ncbi:restriction endonuclease subunit S [Endozoicomonas sp. G2_1]|uniref:restriction endonuclease subunit S n=1 Tax=Endozoicomonas sp. G2_1 TaxID=2821091 RepID=UPI001ADA319B|nr:restriction endonuclease subunit S [Endozoicomonas sp. G2_1]MBO9491423.1 restriction endonuclease subunit S [Endozoicomonas sp. G2_1]
MQISSIKFSELNKEFRIDAEYYREEILNKIEVLNQKPHDKLENLVDFVVGPFGSTVTTDMYVDESNYRYIRNKDITQFRVKDYEPALIPEELYESLTTFHLKPKDLLLTVVGTLGKAAIFLEDDTKSIFSCKSTLLRCKELNPFYLLAYLNSPTGKLFSLRGKRGAIQEGLNLSDLKDIKVLTPSRTFQQKIQDLIEISFALSKDANSLFNEAQETLLKELNLYSYKPKHDLTFIGSFNGLAESGRIDADYYQPKYKELIKELESYTNGCKTAKTVINIYDSNYTPEDQTNYNYIELSNINESGLIESSTQTIGENLPSRARRKIKKGNVILSSVEGSLESIAIVDSKYSNSVCSTGFYVIDSSIINSETLLVFFKSLPGQMQLKKGCSGTILTAINKDELEKIKIPIIDNAIQNKIKKLIQDCISSRNKAKELISLTLKSIEILVSESESNSLNYIENKQGELNA